MKCDKLSEMIMDVDFAHCSASLHSNFAPAGASIATPRATHSTLETSCDHCGWLGAVIPKALVASIRDALQDARELLKLFKVPTTPKGVIKGRYPSVYCACCNASSTKMEASHVMYGRLCSDKTRSGDAFGAFEGSYDAQHIRLYYFEAAFYTCERVLMQSMATSRV